VGAAGVNSEAGSSGYYYYYYDGRQSPLDGVVAVVDTVDAGDNSFVGTAGLETLMLLLPFRMRR
jgi:hypothetical protein